MAKRYKKILIPFNGWMLHKLLYTHPIELKRNLHHAKSQINLQKILLGKASQPQGNLFYFICVTFLKWQNDRNGKQICEFPELRIDWDLDGRGNSSKEAVEVRWVLSVGLKVLIAVLYQVIQDVTITWNCIKHTWDLPHYFL